MVLPSAAVALLLALVLSAAAAAAPAPIGLPNCNTTCGDVSVPYPFGIQPGCYQPGFNLTCDTSHGSPRLLLGDGTLRVVDIFVQNATVRVLRDGSMISGADNITSDGRARNFTFARSFSGGPYRVSHYNELVLFGCDVLATVVAGEKRAVGDGDPDILGCASFCFGGSGYFGGKNEYCSGAGCCQASFRTVNSGHIPTEVHLRPVESHNHRDVNLHGSVSVYLAEEGWLDHWGRSRVDGDWSQYVDGTAFEDYEPPENDIPLLLRWDIWQGLGLPLTDLLEECPSDVASLCRSKNSECTVDVEVYHCRCKEGYEGNPYVVGGCQDIDECKHPQDNKCFGECINSIGSYLCQCPVGTFGDPTARDGCLKTKSTTTAADTLQLGSQIGLPNCNTSCGDMRVPYPFSITPGCYLPGFDLSCDTSHGPPRLLLGGNSTLQVVDISLTYSMVRVIHTSTFDTDTIVNDDYSRSVIGVRFPDIDGPYMLSTRNEFILTGCDIEATLHGDYSNGTNSIVSRCVSTCSFGAAEYPSADGPVQKHTDNKYCSGRDGCCHAPIIAGSTPKKVTFKGLPIPNISEGIISPQQRKPPVAFVAEEGQIDQWYMILNRSLDDRYIQSLFTGGNHIASQVPLVLRWAVKQQGVLAPADHPGPTCPAVVARHVCKSDHSDCWQENGGYTCHCSNGYYGNPYIADGCQDIDECKISAKRNVCFGNCVNLPGSYECRCPRGSQGDASQPGGCVKSITGLRIGLLVASGPAFLLLVLGVTIVLRKLKQRRIRLLKERYFKQNRGQLLQQLVSQRADIAERMIIPVDELAKATNNFDKARELGGGGHGTVYKGILSDLQVVAIKKSKITVQKEIDEFINEVAILSQINHRNVVKLFGCCLETEVPLLVYEFISNGTLYHHLHVEGPRSLSWGTRLRVATETASALSYLHSSMSVPVIHRDIKSSNILLDDTFMSKVSDFGASRYIPVDKTGLTTRVQGTIGYLDPMYFYTGRLTEKSDVYSFGVILVELLTRKKPFPFLSSHGDDGLVMRFTNLLARGNLAQILDPQLIEEGGHEVEEVATLAASCIKLNGDDRPTMRQVEITLDGLQASNVRGSNVINLPSTEERQSLEQSSRRYSMEQEFLMSASYPR